MAKKTLTAKFTTKTEQELDELLGKLERVFPETLGMKFSLEKGAIKADLDIENKEHFDARLKLLKTTLEGQEGIIV